MRCAPGGPLILGALALLGAAACFGCRSTPATRHHVLSPVVARASSGTASAATPRVVGVGPVSLPAYLERPQMVLRTASDIELREFDQWGEPLRDGIARVVAVNLARLLPESLVVVFPWPRTEKIRYQIVLEVAQMDGPTGGNVTLDARWRILDPSGKQVAVRAVYLTEPAGQSAATIASALSRALGTLSRDIAHELTATDGWLR